MWNTKNYYIIIYSLPTLCLQSLSAICLRSVYHIANLTIVLQCFPIGYRAYNYSLPLCAFTLHIRGRVPRSHKGHSKSTARKSHLWASSVNFVSVYWIPTHTWWYPQQSLNNPTAHKALVIKKLLNYTGVKCSLKEKRTKKEAITTDLLNNRYTKSFIVKYASDVKGGKKPPHLPSSAKGGTNN